VSSDVQNTTRLLIIPSGALANFLIIKDLSEKNLCKLACSKINMKDGKYKGKGVRCYRAGRNACALTILPFRAVLFHRAKAFQATS